MVFTYCVTNLIKTVFKYEMPSAAFTWPNLYSLDLSVVALYLWSIIILCPAYEHIWKLKPKNLNILQT